MIINFEKHVVSSGSNVISYTQLIGYAVITVTSL